MADPTPPITQLLIGGELRDAADGATFTTWNPATGEQICQVAKAGAEDLDAALRAARTESSSPTSQCT